MGCNVPLVIGVGSGRDMLSAYLFGFRDITGVELNPIFIDLLTDPAKLRAYAGIADLPGMRFVVDDGRSVFLKFKHRSRPLKNDRLQECENMFIRPFPSVASRYHFDQRAKRFSMSSFEFGEELFYVHCAVEHVASALAPDRSVRNDLTIPSQKHADSAIHLEVRKAYLDLRAAAQRVEVASAAAAEAEEAHRIIQNRHQAGLITVTELLRSETALAAARTRRLAAIYDQRVAAAALDHAAGTLAANSALLN